MGHSGVMLIAEIQNRKGIRGHSLEHAAAFDLFDDGGDKAFAIEGHMERLFCPGDDFRDMKGLIGGEEYVIDDTQPLLGHEVKEEGIKGSKAGLIGLFLIPWERFWQGKRRFKLAPK
jgi:hypothetical protein